jgi:hypothetical protein
MQSDPRRAVLGLMCTTAADGAILIVLLPSAICPSPVIFQIPAYSTQRNPASAFFPFPLPLSSLDLQTQCQAADNRI